MIPSAKMDRDRLSWRLLSAVPLNLWRALSKVKLILPYYHIVTDEEVPHVKHLYGFRNTRQFRADLEFFLANYSPVGLVEVIDHLKTRKNLPPKSFLLTFDDGFREMHDVVAPILKEKGIPATFFLATGFIDNLDMAHHNQVSVLIDHLSRAPENSLLGKIESLLDQNSTPGSNVFARLLGISYRDKKLVGDIAAICGCDLAGYLSTARPYLDSRQIRKLLGQGFTIGAHSVDHPRYSELSLSEQLSQTEESLQFLVGNYEIDYRAFAFPHSDSGVGPEFFEILHAGGKLDVSFGTAGIVKHFSPQNLERFTMEKTLLPAGRILARHYPRGLYQSFAGKAR